MPVLAIVLSLLGVVGLILPILPGLPLLAAAALLFAADRPGLRRRILALPQVERLRALLRRHRNTPGADGLTRRKRARLATLTLVARMLPKPKR